MEYLSESLLTVAVMLLCFAGVLYECRRDLERDLERLQREAEGSRCE